MNCMSKGTQFARAGNISKAQAVLKAYKRGNKRATQTESVRQANVEFNAKMGNLYSAFNQQKSGSEDEAEEEVHQLSAAGAPASSMMRSQNSSMKSAVKSKKKLDDRTSTLCYQIQNQQVAYSKKSAKW